MSCDHPGFYFLAGLVCAVVLSLAALFVLTAIARPLPDIYDRNDIL